MEPQAITARLPRELYEWLRHTAFERRVSQNDILIKALEEYRRREGRKS